MSINIFLIMSLSGYVNNVNNSSVIRGCNYKYFAIKNNNANYKGQKMISLIIIPTITYYCIIK